jgi:hypothetical protein
MIYPTWADMTDKQKFDFLHEWCERLSRAMEQQQAVTQSLHERLRVVEGKVAGKS